MNKPLLAILLAISLTGVIYGAFASQETTAKATTSAAHTTAIRNVRLFDGERVVPHATVVWSDGRIIAAGANTKVPEGAEVIDGSGDTLLPGLIDAHTHA